MVKSGSKATSKTAVKNSGGSSSRGASASRSGWARGGNSGSSHRRGGLGWFSSGGTWGGETLSSGAYRDGDWDAAGSSSFGEDISRALGEGLANGLGDRIGDEFRQSEGSAAFWRGVATCALLVAMIVLVLYLVR